MTRSERYVAFLGRRWAMLVAITVIAFGASVWLVAYHLPLHSDFSNLLPEDAPAVRDLRRLEARVSARDKLLVLVVADDPAVRESAAAELARRARTLPAELVGRVEDDDKVTRDFLRAHRHLFVPVGELEAARDALAVRIRAAKLSANPLFIDLDSPGEEETAASRKRLDDLRARQRDAEGKLERSTFISADGKTQLVVIETGFPKTDVAGSERLLDALDAHRREILATRAAEIGFAGGPVVTLAEHTALIRGMILSSLATAVLVAVVMLSYLRSARLFALLGAVLVCATTLSFGLAVLTVGHLNAATAFLGAIIAGNGVNYGILLIARFREERIEHDASAAMARAIATTLRPTLVASFGAAVAYGSLAATSFQGFSDFAVIGAVGMLVCWIASYTVLPALVLRVAPGPFKMRELLLGAALARTFGFRSTGRVLAVVCIVTAAAAAVTVSYIASDPFEYDITKLRSAGDDATRARSWMARSDAAFGRGITGQTVIAAEDHAQVRAIVDALHRIDRPGQRATIGTVRSMLDVVPSDQPKKLAVLAEIRTMLDDDALAALDDHERAELAALRPPHDLTAVTLTSLPEPLAAALRERDGRLGLLIGVRPHLSIDEWNGRDLIAFANAVRRIELPDGREVTTSGSSVIFADLITTIRDDGSLVTGLAVLGLVIMILCVVGPNSRAAAVLVAVTIGALGLVATCALLGLRVNFLDFIALPITLGLGIDYAINVAERHAETRDVHDTLRTAGAAVFVCSLTTIIGYGSLLVSDNLAIRGFGLASLIGEVACLLAALVVVPAIVTRYGRGGVALPPEMRVVRSASGD